jgi:hypothetical protein
MPCAPRACSWAAGCPSSSRTRMSSLALEARRIRSDTNVAICSCTDVFCSTRREERGSLVPRESLRRSRTTPSAKSQKVKG